MRTSEIEEKIVAQMGLTLDDYYADPRLTLIREYFRQLTRCGPSDEEINAYLHARKPFVTAESSRVHLDKQLNEAEAKHKASLDKIKQVTDRIADLTEQESAAAKVWTECSVEMSAVMARQSKLLTDLKELTAEGVKRPPVKQIAALEKELEACKLEMTEIRVSFNEKYVAYTSLTKEIKEWKSKLKEAKQVPGVCQQETYTIKNQIGRLSWNSEDYYKKDGESLDFLFAVLLGVRLQSKDDLTAGITPTVALSPSEKLVYVSKCIKSRTIVPKDWRQQLHRVCSLPLKRFVGSISNPTEERMTFFEINKSSLSATDMAAFLSLKIAALQHEYILTGAGAIVLALPGGLAASVSIREKGKIIAKQQQSTVETYINLLKSKNQYAYHLMYHYDGGPAEGVGIETPGAYYILSEVYVFEITFMAAPMLLGFDIMAKAAQNISIVARLDEEQIKAEEQLWQQGDWEDAD